MILYRIVKQKWAHDLTGQGAKLAGGRWNKPGLGMLYASKHVSLAALEVLVHIESIYEAYGFKLVVINVPDNLSVQKIPASHLNETWYSDIEHTKKIGSDWLSISSSLCLEVPSVIVPFDNNLLLNPIHPDFQHVEILDLQDFSFENRLFKTHVS